jgi:hypothetical protein
MPLFGFHLSKFTLLSNYSLTSYCYKLTRISYLEVMIIVSSRLWNPNGSVSDHSIDDGMWSLVTIARCDTSASQIINTYISIATNDTIAPTDDTTFHLVNASG